MNKLKLLDLFSGIGGFSLGLESTGYFQTIAFVEKDKYCRQVLQKNFKNIPIEEDIRNVRGSNYAADVITGGFPCQPFSVAGKRKGTADDRYLWDETIRVVAECKPSWFIGENVEGLININNGVVLRQVQTDLEEQGFQVQCLVIPASGIGAWHQRKRIWIVAYSDSNRHSNKIRRSSTKEERISQEHRQDYNTTRKSSGASSVWETNNQHVPNPSSQRFGIHQRTIEKWKQRQEIKKKQGINLHFKLCHHVQMYPTPTTQEIEHPKMTLTKNGRRISKDGKNSHSCQSSGHSKDVSNSNSRLRRGRGTEFKNRDDREWWFYSEEEKQTRNDIRSEVIGCNAILGEDVSNSKSKGSFSTNKSKPSSEEQTRLDINEKKNWSEIWSYASRCNEQVGGRKATYNTPTANDAKNLTFPKSQTDRTSIVGNLIQQKQQIKPGGKLNPNFVEFLMGYPMNWTKIDQAE
jgi:DNA-cytosine methyltransferase